MKTTKRAKALQRAYRRGWAAFTLIEMMIVVVVISILLLITFRLGTIVYEKAARAQAVRQLEHIKLCLEEFYQIYGYYPPASNTTWEDPYGGSKPPDWDRFVEDLKETKGEDLMAVSKDALVYWLGVGQIPSSSEDYVNNATWSEYIQFCGIGSGISAKQGSSFSGLFDYTNINYLVYDPWESAVYYRSEDPYQTYTLYSYGKDTSFDGDDVGREAFME